MQACKRGACLVANFQNTNPERGRKLPRLCSHNVRKPNFRTRTPKGDGNDPNPLTLSQAEESDFRTRTPKGDGNLSVMPISSMSSSFQNTNPERGRKLVRILDDVNLFCPISEHEPRKGTETGEAVQAIAVTASSFQNTNPERGRKLPAVGAFAPCADYFRTRTPKGDGNSLNMTIILSEYVISEHEPRKGTETPSWYVRLGRTPENFRTRTPKGDGNHRVSVSPSTKFCEFQNTNPERGRKLSSSL